MGSIGCVHCENFWHNFEARTFAHFAPSFVSHPNDPKCTKIVLYAPNLRLGSNGLERVHSLRKIPTSLRGTNICTILARFPPSFVTQPNGPQCSKIVWNAPKHEFRVQWGGSGSFVAKKFEATSWPELLQQFGPFCTEFRNWTERSQMHQNCTKRTKTWVQGPMGCI